MGVKWLGPYPPVPRKPPDPELEREDLLQWRSEVDAWWGRKYRKFLRLPWWRRFWLVLIGGSVDGACVGRGQHRDRRNCSALDERTGIMT